MNKGSVFYILSDPESKEQKFKVGITDDSGYRTSIPNVKIEYLIYTDKNKLIEDFTLQYYKDFRDLNHEWIYKVNLNDLIFFVENQCKILSIDFTFI